MAETQMVVFAAVKLGNPAHEWEDGAGYAEGARTTGRARCIVVDGATEAYGAVRWTGQLVASFLGEGGPAAVEPGALEGWFARMQQEWTDSAPSPSAGVYAVYEERKAETGSFATLLGCEIDGLRGREPRWTAAALGDTVLFHVRGDTLVEHFPPMRVTDFGLSPDGVFTLPGQLDRMRARLRIHGGALRVGDRLFVATDALAEWMLRRCGPALWATLDALDHPERFARLVADQRAAKELKNDDVTLLRVEITRDGPDFLKVPQS